MGHAITFGSTITLLSARDGGLLGVSGLVMDVPLLKKYTTESHVVTTRAPTSHGPSETTSWRIVSATDKALGTPVLVGDDVHLASIVSDGGYLDVCGWVERDVSLQNGDYSREDIATAGVFTTESSRRDGASGTWRVNLIGAQVGQPVNDGDTITLENRFVDAPGSLIAYGPVSPVAPDGDQLQAYTSVQLSSVEDHGQWTVSDTAAWFVVGVAGRHGVLRLDGNLDDRPATGSLRLYGASVDDLKTLQLVGGTWVGQTLTASLAGDALPGVGATAKRQIKLTFGDGPHPLIGVIGGSTDIGRDFWVTGAMALVLGFSYRSGERLLPATARSVTSRFATVIFDTSSSAGVGQLAAQYNYAWWFEPAVRVTDTFRAVHLFWDKVRGELALYNFPNASSDLANDPAALAPFKDVAYDLGSINAWIATTFPTETVSHKAAFPEILALLIARAKAIAPSTILGITSPGHGSPVGIMNDMLDEASEIKACFFLIQQVTKTKPFDFLDFGTNCNVASLHNLEAAAPFAQFIVASDLTRDSPATSIGKRPDDHYPDFFKDSTRKVGDILVAILGEYDEVYNDAAAKAWYVTPAAAAIARDWRQQITIFDCSQLPPILDAVGGSQNLRGRLAELPADDFFDNDKLTHLADFKRSIEILYPAYAAFSQDWARLAIKQVSNRSSLAWADNRPAGLFLR